MRKRNLRRGFSVQRLEDRRLLAADFAVELAPVDIAEPEMCEVAAPEIQDSVESQLDSLDLDSTEVPTDVVDEIEVDLQPEVEVEIEAPTEALANNLGDPVDGTDGFFGAIDAENTSQTLTFTPSEAGLIDVVVASSFGDAETRLELTGPDGEVIASTTTEELSGFQTLSFEAEAGETYQLNVSSEDGAEGYFQVTVSHDEIPEPVDQHSDVVGEDSTLLEFTDGAVGLSAEIESAGDVDTFRFTSDADGSVALSLAELNVDNATELEIRVTNSDGQQLTRGVTNETVGVSFDVEAGGEYFVAVSAGEDQTGSFQIDLTLEADFVEPETESDDTSVVEVEGETNDDETTEDVIVSESDVGVESDTNVEPVVDVEPEVDVEPVTEVEVTDVVDVEPVVDVDPVDVDPVVPVPESDDIVDVIAEVDVDIEPEFVEPILVEDPTASEPEVAVEDDTQVEIPVEIVDSAADLDPPVVAVDNPDFSDPIETGTETETDFEIENDQPEVAVVDDESINVDLPIDESIEDFLEIDSDSIDDLVDEDFEVCFSDLLDANSDLVDSFFAKFDPSSIFTSHRQV